MQYQNLSYLSDTQLIDYKPWCLTYKNWNKPKLTSNQSTSFRNTGNIELTSPASVSPSEFIRQLMLNVILDQKSYSNNFCSDWWSIQHSWSDKLASWDHVALTFCLTISRKPTLLIRINSCTVMVCVLIYLLYYTVKPTFYCLPINPGLLPKVLYFSLRIFAEPQLISVLCWLKAFQIDFLVLLFSVRLCPCHLINTFSFLFFLLCLKFRLLFYVLLKA